jgi:hypothetical protein
MLQSVGVELILHIKLSVFCLYYYKKRNRTAVLVSSILSALVLKVAVHISSSTISSSREN